MKNFLKVLTLASILAVQTYTFEASAAGPTITPSTCQMFTFIGVGGGRVSFNGKYFEIVESNPFGMTFTQRAYIEGTKVTGNQITFQVRGEENDMIYSLTYTNNSDSAQVTGDGGTWTVNCDTTIQIKR